MKTNWQTKKLGEICTIRTGKKDVNQGNPKGEYPFFTCAREHTFSDEYSFDTEALLIAGNGDVGYVSYYNGKFEAYQRTYVLYEFIEVLPRYLYIYLSGLLKDTVSKQKLGNTMPYIKMGMLSDFDVTFPPFSEQKKIIKTLDDIFEKLEKVKENTEKNLQNSKELFESYLQSIFYNSSENWEEKKLGDIYDVRDGTHDSPKYQSEGYALITSKNLKKDELDYRKVKFISVKDYENINKRSRVDKGDVLFAMIGTIGNPVVIKTDPDFAIKNVALFKIPKDQNSYFLKYFLDSKFVIEKMMSEAKGTTQKFVGLGYLRDFKIKIPNKLEQEKIVKKLDQLSEQTKKIESIYQNKLSTIEELKKSILSKAFSGGL